MSRKKGDICWQGVMLEYTCDAEWCPEDGWILDPDTLALADDPDRPDVSWLLGTNKAADEIGDLICEDLEQQARAAEQEPRDDY